MTLLDAQAPPGPTELVRDSHLNRVLMAALRIGIGFLWIDNTGWKNPANNFRSLHFYTQSAVSHPVFGPWAFIVKHLVLPNFTFFAWVTVLAEATIGAFLLVGLATRLFALVGLVQVVAITLCALNAPGEWEWSYYLMIGAHLALFSTAAGRAYGIDGLLRPRWLTSDTRVSRLLVRAS